MEEFSPEQPPYLIEAEIEELLTDLRVRDELFPSLSPELQDEWWHVEMEAKSGEDRQDAEDHLEGFLQKLKGEEEKMAA